MSGAITALRFQKRDRQRVNVYLDGQYAFALPAIVAVSLKIGQHLSDADIAGFQASNQETLAHERALRLLANRPRSVNEVRNNLARHGTAPEVIDAVVQRLQSDGYLDDDAFARFWVSDRERFRPRAPQALRQELRQKGVAAEIIAAVLQDVDSHNAAHRAASAYAHRLSHVDQQTFRRKLGGYLLRRGFPHDVVWPQVSQLWREQRGDNRSDQERQVGGCDETASL